MLSTGSKLFVGLAGLTAAAFTVYGITQNFGALGSLGLFFLMLALIGLATAVIFTRDGNISAMDTAAVQNAPAGTQPAGDSMWPFVAAASAVLLSLPHGTFFSRANSLKTIGALGYSEKTLPRVHRTSSDVEPRRVPG